MRDSLKKYGITILGGDHRQVMVAESMIDHVAWVKTYGLLGVPNLPHLFPAANLEEAIAGSRVIILPISGVDSKGLVRVSDPAVTIKINQEFWQQVTAGTLIVTGSFPLQLKTEAVQKGVKIFEYAEINEIAIPNAIPTAEGAIQLAMEKTSFTIDGSCCLVFGFGRVAQALAKRLSALKATIIIAARSNEQLRRAADLGYTPLHLSSLAEEINKTDLIFNTIPALIVTEEIVEKIKPETVIIDLASAPGGVDFQAAGKYGLTAILALGLPGKVAPLTAGKILATQLPGLIKQEISYQNMENSLEVLR
jgi:dipicolinate synthase subunit A